MPSSPTEIAEGLCGEAVVAIELCRGGANNRVYRIETRHATYALKSYGSGESDERDRLGHEFDGLRFLKSCGIGKALPAAVAVDRTARCALYEWIDGDPVGDRAGTEIAETLSLLAALHRSKTADGSSELPTATEAVLRLADLVAQIEFRLTRLAEVTSTEPELATFLDTALRPELERRLAAFDGRDRDAPVEHRHRTLSPSDFGFHNALRRPDGTIAFIDFEYFGWDDPVKLTADFLWHPAMELSASEQRQFVVGTMALYGEDPAFGARLAASFPLYGIRWSLIVLNEFLPQLWARRAFAGKGGDWETAKREQLRKAGKMLAALRRYQEGQFA